MISVVILGMHRSGTSLVAEALAAHGVYVGEPEDLLVGREDNPRGFWERTDIVALNDELLKQSGGSWYCPPASIKSTAAAWDEEQQSILELLPCDKTFLLKDPRMVLTWPAWKKKLPEATLVYVYRSPLAVARSLQRRNGFPLSLGISLWEHYNRLALSAIEGERAICLSYEMIAQTGGSALQDLLEELGDRGFEYKGEFNSEVFDASLGNSATSYPESAAALLSDEQLLLAQYCQALCSGELVPLLPAVTPALTESLSDLGSAMQPLATVVETGLELEHMTALCQERTSERDTGLEQLSGLESSYGDLVKAHNDLVKDHNNAKAALEMLQGIHDHLERDHEELAKAHVAQVAEYDVQVKQYHTLAGILRRSYGNLLAFEESTMGAVSRFSGRCYKLLTLKRGRRSSYDQALEDARNYFQDHQLEFPRKPPGKLSLFGSVLIYAFQNPAGSARSFSYARLQRAVGVFFSAHPEDLDVWVKSRFPQQQESVVALDSGSMDDSLDGEYLEFPACDSPRVSIVIPVYNDYRVTMTCLKSVLENTSNTAYEVIIADDCSTDLTASIAERVANITVVRGEENLRFIGNCNRAAIAARGEFILFLNNDTVVNPQWLDALLATADADPKIGIVGPKLLFADGSLQEAGGIMWQDGSAWNFGRSDDPEKPAYNYVKEVDFVSGACLMIRSGLWTELGGFDRRFTPAYYEDADIAFATREAGYKVVYQPNSVVVHFEGVSNGTELNSGVKQYQVQNQKVFREKWARQLDQYHFPNGQNVFEACDRSRSRNCILIIDHYVPHFDKDAGSRSTFMYIKLMVEMGYRVIFLGANYFPHQPYTEVLQQLGVEVLIGEHMARNQDRWLQANAPYIDRIYLHRPHVAEQFLASLKKMTPTPPITFFGCDLHYLRISRERDISGDEALERSAEKWRQREFSVFDQVDEILYPSQVEVDEILASRPELNVSAIPLYMLDGDVLEPYDHNASADILFVGGFSHPPNIDAICWFVDEVLPIITAQRPGVRLHVVGSNPTEVVQSLQCEQVLVYGYLSDEDLADLYRTVRLSVVPLRYGAGVKGKVLEAVQKNIPLVTTSVGAEGIPDAESVMTIAETAEDFAQRVIELDAGDITLLAKMQNYSQWLRDNYSREHLQQVILDHFGQPLRDITPAAEPNH